MYIMYFNSVVL